jgi:hypothetical protein
MRLEIRSPVSKFYLAPCFSCTPLATGICYIHLRLFLRVSVILLSEQDNIFLFYTIYTCVYESYHPKYYGMESVLKHTGISSYRQACTTVIHEIPLCDNKSMTVWRF